MRKSPKVLASLLLVTFLLFISLVAHGTRSASSRGYTVTLRGYVLGTGDDNDDALVIEMTDGDEVFENTLPKSCLPEGTKPGSAVKFEVTLDASRQFEADQRTELRKAKLEAAEKEEDESATKGEPK